VEVTFQLDVVMILLACSLLPRAEVEVKEEGGERSQIIKHLFDENCGLLGRRWLSGGHFSA